MPTYDYQCSGCGHAFEKFQSITAEPIKKCPQCGKNTAKRLIGIGAGVIFKGGGFYETDYRSDSYKSDAKKDSGDAGKSEGKSDSKKETAGTATKAAESSTAPAKAAPTTGGSSSGTSDKS